MRGEGWIGCGDLKVGDQLLEADGSASTIVATRTEDHPRGITVYNLRVAELHTYFVREEGTDAEPVWAHNADYSVVPNALSAGEETFANEIAAARNGKFVGQLVRGMPGIDGFLDGVPASLKQTISKSPVSLLRYASEAEAQAAAAGYTKVELFIEAKNISAAVAQDFAQNGPLAKIPYQGTISVINILTKDGWIVFR